MKHPSPPDLPGPERISPWGKGELPPPPSGGWRFWVGMLGPGLVLAGTSIGTGEWLFGPAVTAQYGGTLLWLATLSILLQVFCNLMMMRYAIYSGEGIIVGGLRTPPGPMTWVACYAILDLAAIWPFNASNAAVPLAAAWLGRLPSSDDMPLVKGLGYALFVLAFVPLIFGGTVYRMLEKIMTIKLGLVLTYLSFVAIFMVSGPVAWEVVTGFFSFGTVPLRPDTLVVDRHFTVSKRDGQRVLVLRGAMEGTNVWVADFRVQAHSGESALVYKKVDQVPAQWRGDFHHLMQRSRDLVQTNRFHLESQEETLQWVLSGRLETNRTWTVERVTIADAQGHREYQSLNEIPSSERSRVQQWVEGQGLRKVGLLGYVREHGRLPSLDWAIIAAFAAIAGAGGLSNTLFSNYARDKGWGMGALVGAIPSAIGGRQITLSHAGKVFSVNSENLARWRGWMKHIRRDQVVIWMLCSFLGMALPCMMSLEFIRNTTVEGHRVAAMMAEGMASRYPEFSQLLWILTLLCGFAVLAPGQVSVGDQIARRWTDIIWTVSRRARRVQGGDVRRVYYGILAIYGVWGLVALSLFNPLQIAKIGAVLGNLALGVSALHSLYINRCLLPKPLQPSLWLQFGVLLCGFFFIGATVLVLATL